METTNTKPAAQCAHMIAAGFRCLNDATHGVTCWTHADPAVNALVAAMRKPRRAATL